MTDLSPRFGLPLLVAGQAQKELFHNEAIVALETLAQPVAETLGDTAPPPALAAGQSWIVGAGATGEWAGRADALATWTEGGWRFLPPVPGMTAFVRATGLVARYGRDGWIEGAIAAARVVVAGAQVVAARQPAVATPAGGATVDAEARVAVAAMLAALRTHGLIAT